MAVGIVQMGKCEILVFVVEKIRVVQIDLIALGGLVAVHWKEVGTVENQVEDFGWVVVAELGEVVEGELEEGVEEASQAVGLAADAVVF